MLTSYDIAMKDMTKKLVEEVITVIIRRINIVVMIEPEPSERDIECMIKYALSNILNQMQKERLW